jgi:eukaryotic-like serine/threonine-protein kinase
MTAERWAQIKEVFCAALEKSQEERAAWLNSACGADDLLRVEVERLLAQDDGSMKSPAAAVLAQTTPELAAGDLLSHYRVEVKVGQGGMGAVYRAYDVRLRRQVALKVLPREHMVDPESKERLMREARAAAALNHPNIVGIYEVSSDNGVDFIAMEFVEGKTLKEVIPAKGLPMGKALDCAVQIADGLARAHAAGLVHRDLKPGNIMLTPEGLVKVLDFGLARRVQLEQDDTTLSVQGEILGTPAYMSPEQAEGARLDARSDIFSFGAVLYEMVTGHRAFQGASNLATVSAVLNREPPPLAGDVPHELQKLIARCLRKDPEGRVRHIEDVRLALEDLREESLSGRRTAGQASVLARNRQALWPAVAAAALIALIATGVFRWQRTHAAPLTDKDMLVLADFTNTTGEGVFDDTLKQGLSVQLEQSPFLNLVSESKVNETLKLMGRPAGDRLTPEVTREVCQRLSSKAVVAGSITDLGSQYVIGLKAVNCDTGDVLAEAQEQAANKEAVLRALDAAAVRLRSKLGESLASVQKYATPLREATTPSLEALKAYSLAMKTLHAKEITVGLVLLKRAVDLDPNFAIAYAVMSAYYSVLGEGGRAAENARKAYALREKVSEKERLLIESCYYVFTTGELQKAADNATLWQHIYPRDWASYRTLGYVSAILGNWEKALEEFRELVRQDPDTVANYFNLGFDYAVFNRLEEAEAVCKQAEERKLQSEGLLEVRYWLAFLKGNSAQMAQLVSAAMGKPGAEDLLLAAQADTEGWYGKLKKAHELTGRAMDSALRNKARETAAGYQVAAALREVESGNRKEARAEVKATLKLVPQRDVRAMAALALARAGDTAGAEKLAAGLEKTFPLDTLVQDYWLPTIRAGVALERKDPNRAIELLKTASTIELSALTVNLAICLSPAYVRGEAYLMLRDGGRAAAEFQKFIDHRGLVLNFSLGALARLGLARAAVQTGDTARARRAYQDFVTLWKDADPDIPILKEAKAEYARLQ